VAEVVGRGRSLSDLTSDDGPLARLDPGDRAYAMAAVYGTVRWYRLLEHRLATLLEKPLKARDSGVMALLVAGLHELAFLSTPLHAAINEHVAVCPEIGKPWARGLVNAVLRRAADTWPRAGGAADGAEALPIGVETSHPDWFVTAIEHAFGPDTARRLLAANNRQAPMTLRVDPAKTTPRATLSALEHAGIAARPATHAPNGIVLERPVPVATLPGFDVGAVSIQDESAQLVSVLARGALPGAASGAPFRILDACAAPGGKTLALAEAFGDDAHVTALELDPTRAERIRENLVRSGRVLPVLTGDAATPGAWWDGEPYDLVLADVPCTATGVIRRHPDIKWVRREADVAALAARQRAIVSGLWPLLKRNGILIHVTCSVLPAENDDVLDWALGGLPGCVARGVDDVWIEATSSPPGWGHATRHGRQILTGEDDMDGFFYALLSKAA